MRSRAYNRRYRARAQQISRAFLAAYLLVLFTPVSVAANLSLCMCDKCSRLEACPLIACDCQVARDQHQPPTENCGCCLRQAPAVTNASPGEDCPSILMPVTPAAKLKLPQPDRDHPTVLSIDTGLLPRLAVVSLSSRVAADLAPPVVAELRTVRLLM